MCILHVIEEGFELTCARDFVGVEQESGGADAVVPARGVPTAAQVLTLRRTQLTFVDVCRKQECASA